MACDSTKGCTMHIIHSICSSREIDHNSDILNEMVRDCEHVIYRTGD